MKNLLLEKGTDINAIVTKTLDQHESLSTISMSFSVSLDIVHQLIGEGADISYRFR